MRTVISVILCVGVAWFIVWAGLAGLNKQLAINEMQECDRNFCAKSSEELQEINREKFKK